MQEPKTIFAEGEYWTVKPHRRGLVAICEKLDLKVTAADEGTLRKAISETMELLCV
ncbi:MAG TPA: hypothetical protein VKQ11_00545 [Candidatus Sulfotelmatobacter sp.]|nr:hypothetical protein [Candidatus Sulfotelmatobacter sp.]